MLAVMLLLWLPNSAAGSGTAQRNSCPSTQISSTPVTAKWSSVDGHGDLTPESFQRDRDGGEDGGHFLGAASGLRENRWSDASEMFAGYAGG